MIDYSSDYPHTLSTADSINASLTNKKHEEKPIGVGKKDRGQEQKEGLAFMNEEMSEFEKLDVEYDERINYDVQAEEGAIPKKTIHLNANSISVQNDIDWDQGRKQLRKKEKDAVFTDGKLRLSRATIEEIKSYVNN